MSATRSLEWESDRRLEEVAEFARRTLGEFARCAEHRLREARGATLKRELASSARAAARDMGASFEAALGAGASAGGSVGSGGGGSAQLRQFRRRAQTLQAVELHAKVHSWETVSDSEPFVVYVIRSSRGSEDAVVCKRFKHFLELHRAVGCKTRAVLPAKKGVKARARRTDAAFVAQRAQALEHYLNTLCLDPHASQDPVTLAWLGLGLPRHDREVGVAFDAALRDVSEGRRVLHIGYVDGLTRMLYVQARQHLEGTAWSSASALMLQLPAASATSAASAVSDDLADEQQVAAEQQPVPRSKVMWDFLYELCEEHWSCISKKLRALAADLPQDPDVSELIRLEGSLKTLVVSILEREAGDVLSSLRATVTELLEELNPLCINVALRFAKQYGHFNTVMEKLLGHKSLSFTEEMQSLETYLAGAREQVCSTLEEVMRLVCNDSRFYRFVALSDELFVPLHYVPKLFSALLRSYNLRGYTIFMHQFLQERLVVAKSGPQVVGKSLDAYELEMTNKIQRVKRDQKFECWRTLWNLEKETDEMSTTGGEDIYVASYKPMLEGMGKILAKVVKRQRECMREFAMTFERRLSEASARGMRSEDWGSNVIKCTLAAWEHAGNVLGLRLREISADAFTALLAYSLSQRFELTVAVKVEAALEEQLRGHPLAPLVTVENFIRSASVDIAESTIRPLVSVWITELVSMVRKARMSGAPHEDLISAAERQRQLQEQQHRGRKDSKSTRVARGDSRATLLERIKTRSKAVRDMAISKLSTASGGGGSGSSEVPVRVTAEAVPPQTPPSPLYPPQQPPQQPQPQQQQQPQQQTRARTFKAGTHRRRMSDAESVAATATATDATATP